MRKLAYLLLLGSVSAFAGVMNGGGGKGVVCKDSQNKITSVELLDLWEAKTLFGENPTFSIPTNGYEFGVRTALDKLKNSYPFKGHGTSGRHAGCHDQDCVLGFLQDQAALFLNPNPKVLRLKGVTLELTNDSYEVARPTDCEVQQIVNYQKGGKILINQDLYEKMNILNQVALIAHESYYAMLREMALEPNSIRTRRAIGYIMSENDFVLNTPIVPDSHIFCYNEGVPYAPTQVTLSWQQKTAAGPGGLMLYPSMSGGSKFIGLKNRLFNFEMVDSKDYSSLMTGQCDRDGLFMDFGIPMNGPVEFDHQPHLEFVCKNGSLTAYFNDQKPGDQVSTSVPLTCKVHR